MDFRVYRAYPKKKNEKKKRQKDNLFIIKDKIIIIITLHTHKSLFSTLQTPNLKPKIGFTEAIFIFTF